MLITVSSFGPDHYSNAAWLLTAASSAISSPISGHISGAGANLLHCWIRLRSIGCYAPACSEAPSVARSVQDGRSPGVLGILTSDALKMVKGSEANRAHVGSAEHRQKIDNFYSNERYGLREMTAVL